MNKPFSCTKDKPWGKEIIFTPPELERVGKIIIIEAGKRFSLQYHDQKEETLCLADGKAKIWLEDNNGEMQKVAMQTGQGYTILPGQKHRVEALDEAATIFEVSSPEEGKTYRLEDDYHRPTENLAQKTD